MLPDFGSDRFLKQVEWFKGREEIFNSYLLSITALQQGFDVTFYRTQAEADSSVKLFRAVFNKPIFYSISSKRKCLFFAGSSSERDNPAALALQDNKSILKALLQKADVNTPFGGVVTAKDRRVLTALEQAGVNSVTVKPVKGDGSKGVQLYQTLDQAAEIVRTNPDTAYIVEQQIKGIEFRITASKTEVIAASIVIPAHITGDGVSTLKELINREGEARARNPANRSRPIDQRKIVISAAAQGVDGTTVLDEGQLFRYTIDNMPYSAFRVPVLDRLPQNIKDCAIATVRAVDANFFTMDIFADRAGVPYVVDIDGSCAMSKECFPYPNGEWNLAVPEYILKPRGAIRTRNARLLPAFFV